MDSRGPVLKNPRGKLLLFTSRIPSSRRRQAEEFREFVSALLGLYEVHCMVLQTLLLDPGQVEKIKRMGVKIIFMKKGSPRIRWKDYFKKIFEREKYKLIFFDSVYTAKYYLYYIKNNSPESILVLDGRRSHYLMDMKFFTDEKRRHAVPDKTIIAREKEIPVFSCFDAVMVKNKRQKKIIEKEIHSAKVFRYEDKDGLVESFKALKRRRNSFKEESVDTGLFKYSGDKASVYEINKLLRKKTGKTYLLLMPESSQISPEAMERMVVSMESHRQNRIVVPSSNMHIAKYAGVKVPPPEDRLNFNKFLRKNMAGNYTEWRRIKEIEEPCLFIRTRLIDEIGALNESYNTLFYSFLDFGYKALLSGFRIILNKESFIYHRIHNYYTDSYNYGDQRRLNHKWGIRSASFLESLGRPNQKGNGAGTKK